MYICEDKKGRESTLVLEGFKKKRKEKLDAALSFCPTPFHPLAFLFPILSLWLISFRRVGSYGSTPLVGLPRV